MMDAKQMAGAATAPPVQSLSQSMAWLASEVADLNEAVSRLESVVTALDGLASPGVSISETKPSSIGAARFQSLVSDVSTLRGRLQDALARLAGIL